MVGGDLDSFSLSGNVSFSENCCDIMTVYGSFVIVD